MNCFIPLVEAERPPACHTEINELAHYTKATYGSECTLSDEQEIEFKYGEPLNTILLVVILIAVSAVDLFLYFQIMQPSEDSFLYGLNQFYQLGVFFVALLAFILFIARPLIRLILIKPKTKKL